MRRVIVAEDAEATLALLSDQRGAVRIRARGERGGMRLDQGRIGPVTIDHATFQTDLDIVFLFLFLAVPTGWLVVLHDWLDKRAARQSSPALPPAPGEDVSTDR